jgi:hypothetical protein
MNKRQINEKLVRNTVDMSKRDTYIKKQGVKLNSNNINHSLQMSRIHLICVAHL